MKKIQIFLSSRFSEFAELREKIIHEKFSKLDIGLELNALDGRGGIADTRSPVLASIEEADGSDIFILLLGETYGSIPDGYEKSYTHMEYETALKKGLEILAFPIGDAYVNGEYSNDPRFNEWQKDVLVNNRHITAAPYPTIYDMDDIDEVYETIYKSLQEYVNRTFHNRLHKKNPPLTSKLGKDNIIGREKELKEIDKLLNNSDSLLLINGIGGVGKSAIAGYYLHSQKEKYDYYGFFEGLESFVVELKASLNLKSEKLDELFMEALARLRDLDGEKLLVLDDVKMIEENKETIEKILALKDSGYKILLTSREEIEDIEQYYLDVLSIEDAKKLFNSIYKVEDEQVLEEILRYLDCHALFVEITAKTLKNKKSLTAKEIKEKFENGEFSTISVKRKQSFNKFLNELFSFDNLDNEEILLLKQFSALPSIEIDFNFLETLFQKKEDSEFEELLDYLYEKGWLGKTENGYKLHQIIKEYILSNHTPSFEDRELIIDTLTTLTRKTYDIQVAVNNKENIVYFESLAKINENVLGEEHPSTAISYNNLALLYGSMGAYEKVEPLYEKSLDIKKRILGENHMHTATAYSNLGILFETMGEYEKAEELLIKSLEIRKRLKGEEHLFVSESYNDLGLVYEGVGNHKKAEKNYLKSLDIKKSILGEHHPKVAVLYSNMAALYHRKGEYEKARPYYEMALEIRENILGENHYSTAVSYNNFAGFLTSTAEYDQALVYSKKALAIWINTLGKKHHNIAPIYDRLAGIYGKDKKHEKALVYYKKALKIREDVFGVNHKFTATSYNNIALGYESLKEYDKALSFHKKALNIRKATYAEESYDVGLSYHNMALNYHYQEKYEKAFELYIKSIDILTKIDIGEHPTIATVYYNLGKLCNATGELEKAKEYLLKSIKIYEKNLADDHPYLIAPRDLLIKVEEELI